MPAVDLKFHFLAASCAAPYDDEASTSIVPFLTCTHVYVRIVFLLYTRILPQYPTLYSMSTGKVKKIDRLRCWGVAGKRTIVRLITSSTGLVFFTSAAGGEFLLRPRFPATQQPEPEQLFPVSTPAALFPSDSPGNTSSPGNSQPSIVAPNPNNSSGYYPDSLLAPVAAGPAGILTRTIYRLIPSPEDSR